MIHEDVSKLVDENAHILSGIERMISYRPCK